MEIQRKKKCSFLLNCLEKFVPLKFLIVLFIYQGEPEEANDEGGNIAV